MQYVPAMPSYQLDEDQKRCWDQNGYALLRHCLSSQETTALQQWTRELSEWPETPDAWMKYFESQAKLLCRVENFIPYHPALKAFLLDKNLLGFLTSLMGEEAILFKEKINFKLPGGSGFAPHQDAPAFTTFNQNYHITMMVAIDPSTTSNGCLDVVDGMHNQGLLGQATDGTIDASIIEALAWRPIEMEPGDVLFFDSYVPHRSGPNMSQDARRALYITYNRASEGDCREQYYRHKREVFPPEIERIAGIDYSQGAQTYNLANPIR